MDIILLNSILYLLLSQGISIMYRSVVSDVEEKYLNRLGLVSKRIVLSPIYIRIFIINFMSHFIAYIICLVLKIIIECLNLILKKEFQFEEWRLKPKIKSFKDDLIYEYKITNKGNAVKSFISSKGGNFYG